jgi:hypothetical protein
MLTAYCIQQLPLLHSATIFQFLWTYVMGSYWTYGTQVDHSNTLCLRLAPPAADPTNPATVTEKDIYIQLTGLNAHNRTGVFSNK